VRALRTAWVIAVLGAAIALLNPLGCGSDSGGGHGDGGIGGRGAGPAVTGAPLCGGSAEAIGFPGGVCIVPLYAVATEDLDQPAAAWTYLVANGSRRPYRLDPAADRWTGRLPGSAGEVFGNPSGPVVVRPGTSAVVTVTFKGGVSLIRFRDTRGDVAAWTVSAPPSIG